MMSNRINGTGTLRGKANSPKCQIEPEIFDVGMQDNMLHTVTFVEGCQT